MRLRLPLVLLLLVFASCLHAQTRLTGKIANGKNEPVPGVSVKIAGTALGTTTDMEGRYSLTLEAGKKYEIEFSAVGYAGKRVADVEVGPGMDNELNIVLDEEARNMEGVVLKTTSRRQENTAALLSFQKNNTALSSVIAADFIRRTPDKNTGEVLKRVSGASIQDNKFVVIRGLADRYNSSYINGAQLPSSEPDKKAFSFDVIPSQLIDNIIINKTATPDLTGEFAGGLVQVATKDIPSRNEIVAGFGLGVNTQSSFKDFYNNPRGDNEWLGFSNRSLPGNYPRNTSAYNQLSTADKATLSAGFPDDVYRQEKTNAGPVQQYNITWLNASKGAKGGTFGSVIGLTYRKAKLVYAGDDGVVKSLPGYFDYVDNQNRYTVNMGAVANLAFTKGKHKIAFKNLFNQLMDDNYYTRAGFNEDNLQNIRLYSSVLNQRSLYTSQLEGTHGLFKDIKLLWNVNYSRNVKEQPDLRVQTYTSNVSAPDVYALNTRGNNTNRFFSDLKDDTFGYNASLSVPFNLFDQKQTFKIGGSGTVRLRDFRSVILGYNDPLDASLIRLPYDQVFNSNNFREDGFYFSTALQNPSDKYYGISALSAGFLMFDNKLSEKVRLVWGVRAEYFEQFLKSNDPRKGDTALVLLTDKLDILPSANLTISPDNKTNIRVSVSQTVARPEFREIAPFAFFDFEQLASVAGNPELKRSRILNADVRYELYPKAGELFSAGVFFKNFTDPIELKLDEASGGTRRQYQFQNAAEAKLFGVEAEFRKSLSFLSPNTDWLSNLYFNGNISVIFSEVTLNAATGGGELKSTTRPLQGQSPYLINGGFQYDGDNGLGFSLLYNRIGQRLALVGNETFFDIYEAPRNLVDFQVSQKVLKKEGEIKLTISDLFNQRIMTYQNADDAKVYNSGKDFLFSSYTPGTTITLGFTYNFKLK